MQPGKIAIRASIAQENRAMRVAHVVQWGRGMNVKTASISLAAAVVVTTALASTACTASTAEPTDESATGSSTQPLDGTGFGNQGYSCTGAGYCQCSGIDDCDNMFRICKADTYCNWDAHGYRCCCLDYVPLTKGGVSPLPTVPVGAAQ